MPRPQHLSAGRLRLLAGFAALLVLVLSAFAASPAAHRWLHRAADSGCDGHVHPAPAEDSGDDAGCAIVLFAGGVEVPAGPAALLPPVSLAAADLTVTAAEPLLSRPRYLRLPERGPPGLV
jgi:hypothetical protein